MEAHPHVRYVGFPTANSSSHALQLSSRYDLACLTTPEARIHLGCGDQAGVGGGSGSSTGDVSGGSSAGFGPAGGQCCVAAGGGAMDGGWSGAGCDDDGGGSSSASSLSAAAAVPAAAAAPSYSDRPLLLQPCVFWWDSQHLCHRDRYLAIFTPFLSIEPELMRLLGVQFVKHMVLRQVRGYPCCAGRGATHAARLQSARVRGCHAVRLQHAGCGAAHAARL
eukprot:273828-Chlamydomonas_euryale.AAC.15